jgi:hypothetical protein
LPQPPYPPSSAVAIAPRPPWVASAAPAAGDRYSRNDASYGLTIRSAGIEYLDDDPAGWEPPAQGFSYVDLRRDFGQDGRRCVTLGGAYWLGPTLEDGSTIAKSAAPPDPRSRVYHNPLVSRDVKPHGAADPWTYPHGPGVAKSSSPDRAAVPLPAAGPGYKWQAQCADDTHGTSQGDMVNVGGFQVVGSTSQAQVDKGTGTYTATSRAYFLGLEGAKGFDSGSSFMQIVNNPDQPATISYRMSYFNSGDNTGRNGITFGGADIPVQQFADAFNAAAEQIAPALSAAGPAGAATLIPEVGVAPGDRRYSITISAGHANLGPIAARWWPDSRTPPPTSTLGRNHGIRIGSITFQGRYVRVG